jgi:SOH1
MATTTTPSPVSARFTAELEFVLCLSNPSYLQYLALNYPHLLNEPNSPSIPSEDSDATRFARYLAYLYEYWRKPEYSQYLTYPGAALRNLELLQQEKFRRGLIKPDLIAKLSQTEEQKSILKTGAGQQDSAGAEREMDTAPG